MITEEILNKIKAEWILEGANIFEANWHLAHIICFTHVDAKKLEMLRGNIIPMAYKSKKQEVLLAYSEILPIVDLPPDVCGVYLTYDVMKDRKVFEMFNIPSQPDAAMLILSLYEDYSRMIGVFLSKDLPTQVNVYEKGKFLATYSYNNSAESIRDITKVVWTYLKPKGEWSHEQIARYTENWFSKRIMTLGTVPVHSEFNYFHHPELLGLSSYDAVFKLIETMMVKYHDDLDATIRDYNEHVLSKGKPRITKNGLLAKCVPDINNFMNCLATDMVFFVQKLDSEVKIDTSNREYDEKFGAALTSLFPKLTGIKDMSLQVRPR